MCMMYASDGIRSRIAKSKGWRLNHSATAGTSEEANFILVFKHHNVKDVMYGGLAVCQELSAHVRHSSNQQVIDWQAAGLWSMHCPV